jgi:hypothetical protein
MVQNFNVFYKCGGYFLTGVLVSQVTGIKKNIETKLPVPRQDMSRVDQVLSAVISFRAKCSHVYVDPFFVSTLLSDTIKSSFYQNEK